MSYIDIGDLTDIQNALYAYRRSYIHVGCLICIQKVLYTYRTFYIHIHVEILYTVHMGCPIYISKDLLYTYRRCYIDIGPSIYIIQEILYTHGTFYIHIGSSMYIQDVLYTYRRSYIHIAPSIYNYINRKLCALKKIENNIHVAFCLIWHPTMLCCPAYIVCMLVPFIVSCLWLTTVVCMTVVRFQRPDETADRVLFAPDHFLLSEYPSSVAIEVGRKKSHLRPCQ